MLCNRFNPFSVQRSVKRNVLYLFSNTDYGSKTVLVVGSILHERQSLYSKYTFYSNILRRGKENMGGGLLHGRGNIEKKEGLSLTHTHVDS